MAATRHEARGAAREPDGAERRDAPMLFYLISPGIDCFGTELIACLSLTTSSDWRFGTAPDCRGRVPYRLRLAAPTAYNFYITA